jgi:hypothetical protein
MASGRGGVHGRKHKAKKRAGWVDRCTNGRDRQESKKKDKKK